MIYLDDVIARAQDILKEQGTEIRSRQIVALAKAIVEEVNKELEKVAYRR